jgi:drug/metabolite transporter (DMT)-like permease
MSMPVSSNLRGIALMVLATFVFIINDTFMKLATDGLPPLQVLFLRGVAGTLWCTPLVLFSGHASKLGGLIDRWVLARNFCEVLAVLCFIIALANMPIADVTALGQVAPMLLLIGVSIVYGDKIGVVRMALIALGFVGALLVAQPGGTSFTAYAFLGFGSALFTAARDTVGRKVPARIPSLIVAYCTLILVMLCAGLATLIFEDWVVPTQRHLLLLAGSGFFLTLGHLFIFMAYRAGATTAVAPFMYMFTVWAVISGLVVFQTVPNSLALVGIALILASGVTVALMDERKRRLLVTA